MKKLLCVTLALLMVFALAACGGGDTPAGTSNNASTGSSAPPGGGDASPPPVGGDSSSPPAGGDSPAPPVGGAESEYPWNPDNIRNQTFVLAHGLAAESMTGQQYHAFAVAVEELSGGKMVVDEKVGATLLTDTETFDAVRSGTVDFIHSMGSFVSGTVTDITPMTIAGYYGGSDWPGFADRVYDVASSIYADYGAKYLGALAQGNSVIATSERQITAPGDVVGLTMRASGTWLSKTVDAWGGSATVISLADLADSFNRGVVQGVMTGLNIIVPFKIYEVAEYITTTTISEGFAALLMSMDRFNELNADEQALIEYAGLIFQSRSLELAYQYMDLYLKEIDDSGLCQVVALSPAQEAEFIRIAYSLFPQMEAEENLSSKGLELIRILKEVNGIS